MSPTQRIRTIFGLTVSALIVAGCSGDEPVAAPPAPAAESTATPDATSEPDGTTESTDEWAGETIPPGTYSRVATREQGLEMGLAEDLLDAMTGPDGEVPLDFEVGDGQWKVYVTNDAGIRELGDLGTHSYDAEGRWVTVSESSGCPGCVGVVEWTLVGDILTLTIADIDGGQPPADDERFVTEGEYTRQAG